MLRYSDIIALLPSLCAQTPEYFTQPVTLALEDSYLLLNVRQANYDDRFLEELQVRSSYVAQQLTGYSGWLIVTSGFGTA
ncbi:MAG: hypothetical protein IT210_01760 [Armatimonadetes bacterium]|nr:hypothetical protein [Armatimonadota bacterium]